MLVSMGLGGWYLKRHVPVITNTVINQQLSGKDYQQQLAVEKQQQLWQKLSDTAYSVLPPTNSAGVTSGSGLGKLNSLVKILDATYLRNSFDHTEDVRPAHDKLFHPFGAVAKVQIETKPGHPFTGMFQHHSVGIARLSLAASDSPTEYAPGIALKLFVDGQPSVNIMAVQSLDPQTSRDFFQRTPSNIFPVSDGVAFQVVNSILTSGAGVQKVNELSVDHFARITPEGRPVAYPVAPKQIEFRPAQVHFDPASTLDFREEMAKIPQGSVIYEIWAKVQPDSEKAYHVADVKTASPFVASQFGDQELNFQHPRR